MGGTLTFKAGEVRRLLGHSKAAREHRPSYEDLFEPAYHKGGVVKLDANKWPDSDNIDRLRIPAGLQLVGDQGVYLMSNGLPALLEDKSATRNIVAYALESDPRSELDDWYDAKRSIMGGDDCVITLPAVMFEQALARLGDDGHLRIKVTDEHVEVLVPRG